MPMEPWAARNTVSGATELFEGETRVFEDLEEQALGKISGMHWNHQGLARKVFKDQMRDSGTGLLILRQCWM